jgi:hypothetical protein
MPKSAALCAPNVLAQLDPICGAVLQALQASPAEYHCPAKPERLRSEVNRRVRMLGAEDQLDSQQIKRAVIRSFRKNAIR